MSKILTQNELINYLVKQKSNDFKRFLAKPFEIL